MDPPKEQWKMFDGFVKDKDGNECMRWLVGSPKEIFELCKKRSRANLGEIQE